MPSTQLSTQKWLKISPLLEIAHWKCFCHLIPKICLRCPNGKILKSCYLCPIFKHFSLEGRFLICAKLIFIVLGDDCYLCNQATNTKWSPEKTQGGYVHLHKPSPRPGWLGFFLLWRKIVYDFPNNTSQALGTWDGLHLALSHDYRFCIYSTDIIYSPLYFSYNLQGSAYWVLYHCWTYWENNLS